MKASAKKILKKINNYGYEAYLVGGCVRDEVLGKKPHDFDIATNMPMEEIKKYFKVVPVGEQYGVLIIMEGKFSFEIAQFRGEIYRNNSRKPEVTFGKSLQDDVARRDFTINSMAMDVKDNIIASEQALKDIDKGLIRFVGEADTRIQEDPLRILRGVRFAVRYNFKIVEKTFDSMKRHVELLHNIPYERIQDELNKGIMLYKVDEYFNLLHAIGALGIILPELDRTFDYHQKNSHHEFTLDKHMLTGVVRSPLNLKVRWAVLLHDIGKPDTAKWKDTMGRRQLTFHNHQQVGADMAYKIMTRLKFSNEFRHFVTEAVLRHMGTFDSYGNSALKRLYDIFGKDLPLFIQVKIGDYYGHPYNDKMIIKINKMLDLNDRIYKMMYDIIENQNAFKKSDLTINGNTLIKIGYKPGKLFSTIINDVFDKVLDGALRNDEEVLIQYIKAQYKE